MSATTLPDTGTAPTPATPRTRRRRSVNLAVGGALFGLIAVIGIVSVFWTPFSFDDTGGGASSHRRRSTGPAPIGSAATCSRS